MRAGSTVNRLVTLVNKGVTVLTRSSLVRRRLITITYVGRRSGKTFTTPVEHRRDGDVVTIGVQFPDAKNWWRNFLDDGGPITLHLNDGDRTGHATAHRNTARRATVTVHLDPQPS